MNTKDFFSLIWPILIGFFTLLVIGYFVLSDKTQISKCYFDVYQNAKIIDRIEMDCNYDSSSNGGSYYKNTRIKVDLKK